MGDHPTELRQEAKGTAISLDLLWTSQTTSDVPFIHQEGSPSLASNDQPPVDLLLIIFQGPLILYSFLSSLNKIFKK